MEGDCREVPTVIQSWVGAEFSNGVYSVEVPLRWKMVVENEMLSLSNGRDDAGIVISVFTSESSGANFDACYHLERYLGNADLHEVQIVERSFKRSYAEYRDAEGRVWYVGFLAEHPHLVLTTLNFSAGLQPVEREACLAAFQSIALNPKV